MAVGVMWFSAVVYQLLWRNKFKGIRFLFVSVLGQGVHRLSLKGEKTVEDEWVKPSQEFSEFIPEYCLNVPFPSPADSGEYVDLPYSEKLLYLSKYALLHSFGSWN